MRIISPCSKLALRNFMLPCEIMLRISNIRNILKLCTESSASLTRGLSNFGYVQVCIEMYLAKDVLPFPSVNVSFHCFRKQRIARNFKLKFLSENESSTLTIFHRLNREFIYWNLRVMSIPQTISIHLRSLFASRRSRIFYSHVSPYNRLHSSINWFVNITTNYVQIYIGRFQSCTTHSQKLIRVKSFDCSYCRIAGQTRETSVFPFALTHTRVFRVFSPKSVLRIHEIRIEKKSSFDLISI